MCGHYFLHGAPRKITDQYPTNWAWNFPGDPSIKSRFDIKPAMACLIVRERHGQFIAEFLQWGIERDVKGRNKLISTIKTENHRDWPWRHVQHQRCLILTTGWYEHQDDNRYAIHYHDYRFFTFGGLWFTNQGVDQFVLLTTASADVLNPDAAIVHHRMPLIIPPAEYANWLDPNINMPPLTSSNSEPEIIARPMSTDSFAIQQA